MDQQKITASPPPLLKPLLLPPPWCATPNIRETDYHLPGLPLLYGYQLNDNRGEIHRFFSKLSRQKKIILKYLLFNWWFLIQALALVYSRKQNSEKYMFNHTYVAGPSKVAWVELSGLSGIEVSTQVNLTIPD